jgi:hypothetical protein
MERYPENPRTTREDIEIMHIVHIITCPRIFPVPLNEQPSTRKWPVLLFILMDALLPITRLLAGDLTGRSFSGVIRGSPTRTHIHGCRKVIFTRGA